LQYRFTVLIMGVFAVNAWWNFRFELVRPLQQEYATVKNELMQKLTSKTDSVVYVQPPEHGFISAFGIAGSWDEFGIPATAKPWVPDPLIRQLVFEITGNRQRAEQLVIETCTIEKLLLKQGYPVSERTVLLSATAEAFP